MPQTVSTTGHPLSHCFNFISEWLNKTFIIMYESAINALKKEINKTYTLSYFPNSAFCKRQKDIVFYFDPSTAKFSQRQISTKIPNFILWNFEKQIAPCESTGRELSFEWSHHRILSADSKVKSHLTKSIAHSGSERVNCTLQVPFL